MTTEHEEAVRQSVAAKKEVQRRIDRGDCCPDQHNAAAEYRAGLVFIKDFLNKLPDRQAALIAEVRNAVVREVCEFIEQEGYIETGERAAELIKAKYPEGK